MTTLSIVHLCMANAHRDERNETYRLGKRLEGFKNLLTKIAPDTAVLSVKEIRRFKSEDGHTVTPDDLVRLLSEYSKFGVAGYDPVKLTSSQGCVTYTPFYLAQLYNPNKVVKISSKMVRYYDKIYPDTYLGSHFGSAYLICKYAPLNPDGTPDLSRKFVIQTHHFPLQGVHKLKTAVHLNNFVNSYPTLRIGDFNLFRDESEHDVIYTALTHSYKDVTTELTDLSTGKPVFGTFFPFPHDKTPVIISPPDDPSNPSRLDYAFSDKLHVKSAHVILDEKINGIPISDHLPLIVNIVI